MERKLKWHKNSGEKILDRVKDNRSFKIPFSKSNNIWERIQDFKKIELPQYYSFYFENIKTIYTLVITINDDKC